MKKTKFTILITLFCFIVGNTIAQNDFKIEFAQYDSLSNLNKLVFKGEIYPNWADKDTFYYETREKDGLKYYRVTLADRNKTLCNKEDFPVRKQMKQDNTASTDTILSPDKKWNAYIRDSNIWIKEVDGKEKYKLSYDGTASDSYTEIHWSPDSKKIAAIRTQDAPMHKIPLLESSPAGQIQPMLNWKDYYKPGDLIPVNRVALFDIPSKSQISVDTKPFDSQFGLDFGKWMEDSKSFTFEFNQRGHQVYQLVSVNSDNGQTFVIIDERSPTFIYYRRLYRHYTEDGKSVIWASERDNWRHLYLVDIKSGQIKKQLTKGEWVVRDVLHIDEKENYMIISGNGRNSTKGEDPYNIHYYRVNLVNGDIVDLTPENANHNGYFSPDFAYLVDSYSRPDVPAVAVVRSAKDGKVVMQLQEADITSLLETGYTPAEVFHTKGRDGKTDIWGNIYRPSNFDPAKSYPVIEYIYAGPHDSFVAKDFIAYLRFSKLLEMGFIVVTIDGMGTANRSKSFHDVAWRDLKDSGFPDRMVWIKEVAKKYKYMDIGRMGIYGYSAGGQSTLAALLFYGDFYKVGVSLCGCHDNRMDKIWWNEQWMGYPVGPWYSECSNVDNAHKLTGKLLLINGELDDNVDPASTLQVVNALVKADKDFEQLYLPGYGHSLGDNYVTRKVFEFFVKHLR